VPEGLIEFIPEISFLIGELNDLLARRPDVDGDIVISELSDAGAKTFKSLPAPIQTQLLLDRDAHGNVQVSRIDTQALLAEKVRERIPGRFQCQHHFFGYEGRCAAPSNFDADYTYALGHVAAALIANRRTGYICAIGNLSASPESWQATGVPLVSLMQMETRKGKPTPVIAKALVRLDGQPFRSFAASRPDWEREDHFIFPGAIQYFGPPEVCDSRTRTLKLEYGEGAE
jgi:pyrophosphate--fructose-6-phosphate 1-phosphotransferase